MRDLDATLRSHIRASVDIGSAPTEIRRATYPLPALQELVRNAIMHRTYEATHSPVQIAWFTDRVEIASPGGHTATYPRRRSANRASSTTV